MGEPRRIELTDDLLEFAKGCAIREAGKHCPRWIDYNDVVQEVMLKLLSRPPKHDPSKGASEKTLIYTVVQRIVLKYAGREKLRACRFQQVAEPDTADKQEEGAYEDGFPVKLGSGKDRRRAVERRLELLSKSSTTDDILRFIDNEESRAFCRLVIECGGNLSEAARRLGVSEGTVRYRLKMLAPKLRAAGFDPFGSGENG